MTTKAFFRSLVVATFLAPMACVVMTAVPGNISEDWRTITEWHGNGGFYDQLASVDLPSNFIPRIAVITLLVSSVLFLLSVYVGLILFWRFARLANLLLTILFLILAPWAGLVVLLPSEAALYDFTMLCEGAVIALSYTAPIKGYFDLKQIT